MVYTLNRRAFIKSIPLAAALLSSTETYAQWSKASKDTIAHLPGVQRVFMSNGQYPDAIYFLFPHPQLMLDSDFGASTTHLSSVVAAVHELHRIGVNNLLIEGLSETAIYSYLHNRKLGFPVKTPTSKEYKARLEEILKKGWNLYAAEDEEIWQKIDHLEKPINEIRADFNSKMRTATLFIMNKYIQLKDGKEIFPEARIPDAKSEKEKVFRNLIFEYEPRLRAVLTDNLITKLHEYIVIDRQMLCAEQAHKCKQKGGQLIMLYGHSHCYSLLRALGSQKLTYVGIIPKGMDYAIGDRSLDDFRKSYNLPQIAPPAILDIKTDKGNPAIF